MCWCCCSGPKISFVLPRNVVVCGNSCHGIFINAEDNVTKVNVMKIGGAQRCNVEWKKKDFYFVEVSRRKINVLFTPRAGKEINETSRRCCQIFSCG